MPITLFEELLNEFLNDLPVMLAAGLLYWFIRRNLTKKRFGDSFKEVRRKTMLNNIIGLLLVMWAALIVCSTLLPPWGYMLRHGLDYRLPPHWKLLPKSIIRIIRYGNFDPHDLLNVLMFVPVGLAVPFMLNHTKFRLTLLIGFCFTFQIELIQGFSALRDGNTDDLISNTLGVIAGYLLFLLMKLILPKFTAKCMVKEENKE